MRGRGGVDGAVATLMVCQRHRSDVSATLDRCVSHIDKCRQYWKQHVVWKQHVPCTETASIHEVLFVLTEPSLHKDLRTMIFSALGFGQRYIEI